jgi:hypothetical protein|tara:strand:- start:19 stop:1431 length:1413 start_codon:yes stop_codon:yes gene_type:complete
MYEDIDFSPPQGVRSELARGLAWHEEGHSGDGLKPETVAWARRLERGEDISPDKARKMRAWLARHESDKKGEGFDPGEPGYPSPGRVAWALWGGDPAIAWSSKLVRQMDAEDSKMTAAPLGPVVLRQLEAEALPELPEDPAGRHMSWVVVLAGPQVHYHGELREWDLSELVNSYTTYTTGGFEAPVIAEHDPSVTGGRRLGDLVEVREHDGGLIGMVRWAIPDAADLIESGQIRYTSPGIGHIELHDTGEVLETVYEISVVTSPHQRGAETHVLAKGVEMPEGIGYDEELEEQEVEETEENEEMSNLLSRLASMEQAIASLMGEDKDEEEEEEMAVAASAEAQQIAALSAQVAELTRERDYEAFRREVVVGSTFTVTEDNLEALFSLHQVNPEGFAQVAATATLPVEPKAPVAMARVRWAERLGAPEAAEPNGTPTNSMELKALCLEEAGGNKQQANKLYLERAPKMGIL